MIRSLNHIHYISSDQSHSVKARYMKPLAKPFPLFFPFCENCIIKTNVHSHLLWYIYIYIYIYIYMSSSLWISWLSTYSINNINTLHCTKGLYSIKARFHALPSGCSASPSSKLWARTVSDTASSRQPWTGLHHCQAKTPEKYTIKRVL
jgi:hypothetical protein